LRDSLQRLKGTVESLVQPTGLYKGGEVGIERAMGWGDPFQGARVCDEIFNPANEEALTGGKESLSGEKETSLEHSNKVQGHTLISGSQRRRRRG